MSTLTVTAKGQVTLRKALLDHLGVGPGDKITVDTLPGGRIEVRSATPPGRIEDVFGSLAGDTARTMSLEEIDTVIADAWAARR